MVDDKEIDARVARLARSGRARDFAPGRFRAALAAAAHGTSRKAVLRRLLAEWAGITVEDDQAESVWQEVERTHALLRRALGPPVSLQTALLHELHSKRGLLHEPRMVSEHDLVTLRGNAITDPLTGLYNRRFLHDHLERELSRAERSGGVVSVLLMDLRGFKGINDRLGHPVGDGVLVRTARRIRESLRVVDAGCRFGGDEFVAVLPNTDLVHSLAVAERIRQRVSLIRLPLRVGLNVDLNYGIATYPADGRTFAFIMKMSDVRLYASKENGRTSDHRPRRYPRFAVPGLTLDLGGRHRAHVSTEVRDIGYGGLSFTYAGDRLPGRLEGEIAQRFSSETHAVSMRPVSVVPLRGGRLRVGCAYEH
jgi:diguanylate cyclase (GGDEF)-like protein